MTYVPDEYEPEHVPVVASSLPGQFGVVHPSQRTSRAVWVALLLIAASVIAFVGWRAHQGGGSGSSSGVTYTSATGHFTADFPAQPVELSRSERHGTTQLTMHMAVLAGQGSVGEVEIHGPLGSKVSALARGMAAGVGSDGITLSSVKHFTFHGMRAVQGNYFQDNTGELASALFAVASKRRMYLVLGLTGPTFDGLKQSFRIGS